MFVFILSHLLFWYRGGVIHGFKFENVYSDDKFNHDGGIPSGPAAAPASSHLAPAHVQRDRDRAGQDRRLRAEKAEVRGCIKDRFKELGLPSHLGPPPAAADAYYRRPWISAAVPKRRWGRMKTNQCGSWPCKPDPGGPGSGAVLLLSSAAASGALP